MNLSTSSRNGVRTVVCTAVWNVPDKKGGPRVGRVVDSHARVQFLHEGTAHVYTTHQTHILTGQ